MHILIIGCGLAGLTISIALAKGGHTVQILESSERISYVGAGIQVTPNSSKVLRKLGIDSYIEKYCTNPVDLRMMRWKDGQILVECPLKEPAKNDYMSPYWHVHRADLHRGLLDAATNLGCKIRLNSRVVNIDPSLPALSTQDGKIYSADLIVASDGLHSMAREVILGRAGAPIPTGQMAYRVVLPAKKLEGIPELEEIISIPRNNHWLGPNATILSYLLEGKEEKLLNLVFTCDANMPDGTNQRIQSSAELRDRFKDWDTRIGMILDHVDTVLEWRLYTHEELDNWVHNSGKLCLIGDAAHAMTPYLAQGAAMGIEDAAILGALLEKFPTKDSLPEVLSMYCNLRRKRTAKVAKASIESRYFTQMPDGDTQKLRDEYLLTHPGIWQGHMNIRSRQEFLDELFGYDAYKTLDHISAVL
ncbi:uncharacterized protein EAE98_012083 [Botrytis deweyae]|uniref:FAD-binding domain-containing protein n=1 Tax=Botrytis deweyae TaxID=2478750 RepID=A0ABQ7I401_9HELO|nr:uncharacterized protein EAE98_012083 [Botrytis deweyae]KAF7910396.1 hypothetical protein EAE98_012083 [Botrytis deweyae]